MKKLLTVIIGIVIVLFAVSVFKDVLIKTAVEKGVQMVTGLALKIQGFKVGIINTLVSIKGLRLYNPAGFKDQVMLDMPEIYVDYDLPAIMKGMVHLNQVRIDMREFVVVKNEKGQLNLDSLKVVQAQKEKQKPEAKDKGAMPQIRIDILDLKIGKVIYKDYSLGSTPIVKEFNVNVNERYTNIMNPYSLVSLIVVKALMNTSIASLANFDIAGLKGTVSGTLASAQKVAVQAAAQAQKTLTETTAMTQEAVKETTEAVQKTAENLKGALTLPFGGEKK